VRLQLQAALERHVGRRERSSPVPPKMKPSKHTGRLTLSPVRAPALEPRHAPAQVKRLRDRLRRAEGQVRGVQRMLDEDRTCEEVVTQLLAARSALDQVIREAFSERVAECLATLPPADARAAVSRAVGLLVRA
jgi:DNA-binding FrmR family transcriptional regulator